VSRNLHVACDISYDDPDYQRAKGVLDYYGSAAGFSHGCAADLTILIKQARGDLPDG
jgi:hypothetical protein